MSNLRWILLLAGVAILVFLYFTGRPKAPRQDRHDTALGIDTDPHDPADPNDPNDPTDPHDRADFGRPSDPMAAMTESGDRDGTARQHDPLGDYLQQGDRHDQADVGQNQYAPDQYGQDQFGQAAQQYGAQEPPGQAGYGANAPSNVQEAEYEEYGTFDETRFTESLSQSMHSDSGFDPDDFVRPAAAVDDYPAREELLAPEVRGINNAATEQDGRPPRSSIGEKIEAFGARLSPRRKNRIAASVPRDPDGKNEAGGMEADKIISLHVVTPAGQIIPGQHLLDVFESRGYHYGDMNIFHSLHNNKTLFSIAKAVEPGNFDINDVQSFDTPGVTLILQLPGPVQGDVAFEVLISEAHELASLLGCKILDSDRSTLGKQTVQHLRESVYEYLHRQKYFNKTPS